LVATLKHLATAISDVDHAIGDWEDARESFVQRIEVVADRPLYPEPEVITFSKRSLIESPVDRGNGVERMKGVWEVRAVNASSSIRNSCAGSRSIAPSASPTSRNIGGLATVSAFPLIGFRLRQIKRQAIDLVDSSIMIVQ
jgi:hypothetical protein